SGFENVGAPPAPPTEPVVSVVAVAPPMLVLPPPEVAVCVESPVVTPVLPPEPVVAAPLVEELLDVTDTMPAVIVAAPVVEGPVVGPPPVMVWPALVFVASAPLSPSAGAGSEPLHAAKPRRRTDHGSKAGRRFRSRSMGHSGANARLD